MINLFAHVILTPHAHPEDILGIGIVALAAFLVAYAMKKGER